MGAIIYQDRQHAVHGGEVGPVAQLLYKELQAIQYGEKEDPFGWNLVVQMEQLAKR